jgi:hypothetical protein
MLSSPTRSLPYCLGGLKTVHGRYVVDGRLFVGTEEPATTRLTAEPEGPVARAPTQEMTIVSIQARTRNQPSLRATSECKHPSQNPWNPVHTGAQPDAPTASTDTESNRATYEVVRFRTHEHPRERGPRLFHTLGPGVTALLERCTARRGTLFLLEPIQADWGGFPTAALLMLLGVPAATAAAALAEAFAPLDRSESQRRLVILTELLGSMERTYGSSVRFALAHGSDAALLGNLRFSYLAR